MSNQDLDVLDCTDKIFLNGNLPETPPPGTIKAVPDASCVRSFHAVLASFDISSCFRALRYREHCIQIFLSDRALNGAATVVPGTVNPELAYSAVFPFCHILNGVAVGMIGSAREFLPGRTVIGIG